MNKSPSYPVFLTKRKNIISIGATKDSLIYISDLNSDLLIGNVITNPRDLITMGGSVVYFYNSFKKTAPPLLPKRNVLYTAMLIEINCLELVQSFNKSNKDCLWSEKGDAKFEKKIFLLSILSVDSSQERSNYGFCSRVFSDVFKGQYIYEFINNLARK